MDKYMEGKGPAVLAALDAIAEKHGATPAQIALAWVMAKPAIAAPIASATNVDQLSELMGALKVSLSNDDIGVLDAAGA
jgi:aryl-alcohol dehydrogenase-like predicted oxidoreductase